MKNRKLNIVKFIPKLEIHQTINNNTDIIKESNIIKRLLSNSLFKKNSQFIICLK